MELTVLGSSSAGNCYILQNEHEALVIEAGVSLKEVKKAVDFNVSKIVGCIVTHEHGDHAKYVSEFMSNRISTYMTTGTANALWNQRNTKILKTVNQIPMLIYSGLKKQMGSFTVLPFDIKHDAAEPLGFLIHHPETGNVLFVTDSFYIPYKFDNLNNILIEANYSTEILKRNIEAGKIPVAMQNRILQSHMSLETCKDALLANDLTNVNNIVLIHLSDGNSNENEFYKQIYQATGRCVKIASKGLKINFDKCSF